MNQALIDFFLGTGPDHRGRLLADILRRDDRWLEATHDFIQWLFPLAEPSGVNAQAPVVDDETAQAFRADERLQRHQLAAFMRMLRFYGLQYDGAVVTKAASWSERKGNWFTQPTHNNLRITRMLKSLRLLGLDHEARAFHAALEDLCDSEPDGGVGRTARIYWLDAMEGLDDA